MIALRLVARAHTRMCWCWICELSGRHEDKADQRSNRRTQNTLSRRLLRRSDHDHFELQFRLGQLGLKAGARRRVGLIDPAVPHLVHGIEIRHVGEHNGDEQQMRTAATQLVEPALRFLEQLLALFRRTQLAVIIR